MTGDWKLSTSQQFLHVFLICVFDDLSNIHIIPIETTTFCNVSMSITVQTVQL